MRDDVGSNMVCKSFMERIREADKDVAVVDEKKNNDADGRLLAR
jgi:hypothetical protein